MERLPAAPDRKEDPRNFLKSPGGSEGRIMAVLEQQQLWEVWAAPLRYPACC